MMDNNRITYDAQELTYMLESKLDKFNMFKFSSKYRELLGEDFIKKLNEWDDTVRRQKNATLTLVVCGEFKRGKSSLINAILGEDVVTVNVTTETITTNTISYGVHSNELVLPGGKRVSLSDEEMKCENLKKILDEFKGEAKKIEIKRPIEALKQVTIIDTPGLGDALEDFDEDVRGALNKADAVIYVSSALYPMSIGEQLFIKTAIKPNKFSELFIVSNSCDALDEAADCERLKRVFIDRMEDILPGEEPVMLSALDERCRQMGKKRPNEDNTEYLENNFKEFRERLEELFYNKKSFIIPDRIQRLATNMAKDLTNEIDILSEGLEMDVEDIAKREEEVRLFKEKQIESLEKTRKDIDDFAQTIKSESVGWMMEFIENMLLDVDNLSIMDGEDIKKYYPVFCIDTLEEAFKCCVDDFIIRIYKEAEKISENTVSGYSYEEKRALRLRFGMKNKTWTKGDNIATINEMMGLTYTLIGVPIDFVAGLIRHNELKKSAPDLIGEIKMQYINLKATVPQALMETYDMIIEETKVQIGEYFDNSVKEMENMAEQATMVARRDEEGKAQVRAAIDEVRNVIAYMEEELSLEKTCEVE